MALEHVGTQYQALRQIKVFTEKHDASAAMDLLGLCQQGALELGQMIEQTEGEDSPPIRLLEMYCEEIYRIYEEIGGGKGGVSNCGSAIDEEKAMEGRHARYGVRTYQTLKKRLIQIENSIKNDIEERIEAIFLPYKASMWDSMESVWRAAGEDESCDANVIPIPYFDKNPDGSFREEHWEIGQYPAGVPVTDYRDYNFEKRRPDMIFIHNPYDECNYVTSIHPFFYSENLKQFTDKLIYIPYFILGEISPDDPIAVQSVKHFCDLPAVVNADRVIVQSEAMRRVYIDVMSKLAGEETRNCWEKKILGLGSPKVDKVLGTRREELEIPEEWMERILKPDGTWKKIILYNTSVTALLQSGDQMLLKIKDVLKIFNENRGDTALLWRPHPLIQATIGSMRPQLLEEYKKIVEQYRAGGWGIYDDTPDMDRAVLLCDGYYGDWSSIVQLCQKAGKPVMLQNVTIRYI